MKNSKLLKTFSALALIATAAGCSKVSSYRGSGVTDAQIDKYSVRSFDQMNETMSALTGVPVAQIATRFNRDASGAGIRADLPGTNAIREFGAAQQGAVFRLATYYCDALTVRLKTMPAERTRLLPSFADFPADVASLDNAAVAKLIADNYRQFWGACNEPPSLAETQSEVGSMIADLKGQLSGSAQNTVDNYISITCATFLSSSCVSIY